MIEPPNAAGKVSSRPWWNFTLRELLLLMVAVGACIALFRKEYYSGRVSPFVSDLRMDEMIIKVIVENGGKPFVIINGGGCGSLGNGIGSKHGTYYLDPHLAIPPTFMRDLQSAVREKLIKDGCSISSNGRMGRSGNITKFDFQYLYVNNIGLLTVAFHPSEGKLSSKVEVTCLEVSRSAN